MIGMVAAAWPEPDVIMKLISVCVRNIATPFSALGIWLTTLASALIMVSRMDASERIRETPEATPITMAVPQQVRMPASDLVGISRQSAVLAFQMGDGFSNAILPWAGATAGMVGLANCSFTAWFKYILPLFLIWTVEGMVLMGIATMIGY